ncbi:MAG: MFS transporter [Myxococcota bacterium]
MKRFIFLMSLFYLIQLYGGNPGLFDIPLQLYLKETLGFSAEQLAWFFTVTVFPWTIKPLWGIISDSYPVFGSTVRSYFILCYALSFGLFVGLGSLGSLNGMILLGAVGLASTAIAFSDVLTDKLMVVEGREEGTTGVLQAAQWSAFSFGGAAMMYLGGWIAERGSLSTAFLLTALVPLLGLVATLALIRERPKAPGETSLKRSAGALWGAMRSRQFLTCAAFIAALRLHVYPPLIFYQRDVLQFDPVFIGTWSAVVFLANGVGAIVFGLYARHIPRTRLLNLTVGFNVVATLGFIFMTDEKSAIAVAIAVGLTDMIGTLGILEVAARSCPPGIEGTAYALMMSVYNLFTRPGAIIGAMLWDAGWSFPTLVLIGTGLTAVCWFLIPFLRLEEEEIVGEPGSR